MTKISNADARALAQLLTAGADQAEREGKDEFDLTASLQTQSKDALDSLQSAIDATQQS